jgi:hypothetical protein
MSRFLLIPSSLCAAVLLAACAQTPPRHASAATDSAPARSAEAAPTRSIQSAQAARQPQHVASVEFRVAQTKPAKNLTEVHLDKGNIWVLPEPVFTRADLNGVGPIKTKQG